MYFPTEFLLAISFKLQSHIGTQNAVNIMFIVTNMLYTDDYLNT